MKYALMLLFILAITPVSAESYCRGQGNLFYDGQQMSTKSGEVCEIFRFKDAKYRLAKFTCPEMELEGLVYTVDEKLTLLTEHGYLTFIRCG